MPTLPATRNTWGGSEDRAGSFILNMVDLEMMHFERYVVICSQTTPAVRDGALCWVKILKVGEDLCTLVSVGGKWKIVSNITLSELVSLFDEAEALA